MPKKSLVDIPRILNARCTIGPGKSHSILQYTPAVVYIKDKEGRYILVNSRFEELFEC